MSLHTRARARLLAATAVVAAGAASAPAPAAAETYEQVRVSSKSHVLYGNSVRVKGYIRPKDSGRTVWIMVRKPGSRWQIVARPKTGREGRFRAKWRPKSVTRYKVRAFLTGSDANPKHVSTTVYRTAHASWYGPGLYGNRTACGQTLTSSTHGVAHKSLPCGTRVSFYYRGRSTTVRVIDRGPYVDGRDYDLTSATANRLGFSGVGTVWAAPH